MENINLGTNKSKRIAVANESFKLGELGSVIKMQFVQDSKTASILQDLSKTDDESSFRLSLRLEKIKGNYAFPIIDVILNEEKSSEKSNLKNHLGGLALYGLENSTIPSVGVEGDGLYERLDVTEAFIHASQDSNWSNEEFSIKLIPQREIDEDASLTIETVELWYEENFIEVGS